MTRGRIAIITPEGTILTSTEFNGDMDYTGHGQELYDNLECVETVEEYETLVREFNDENFRYEDIETYECDDSYLDMKNDYFDKWFSDYVYIKNLSEKPVVFTDANGKKTRLDTETTAVFSFGEFVAASVEDFETRAFIDELNHKKENLSYDDNKNYSDIWNLCSDYDNNHHGIYLTDRIQENDFVDEEVLEYIVKERATDLGSLRCFLGQTYDADLYRLDGYGNLANVERGDFENLISDLVSELENTITIPIAKQEAYL